MDGSGAEKLGAKLLAEIETEGLSEVLSSLRELLNASEQTTVFNIPELDTLLPPRPPAPPPQREHHARSDDDIWDPDQQRQNEPTGQTAPSKKEKKSIGPILELLSPPSPHHPSPAGKTALIHLILTHALLPSSLCSVSLSGLNTTVVLFDPLHHFSPSFLASTMLSHVTTRLRTADLDPTIEPTATAIKDCIKRSLTHLHILHPQPTLTSLLATLETIPTYLLDATRHLSSHRRVHSLILEDAHAFIPSIRATASATPAAAASGTNPISAASAQLALRLERLAALLSCAVLVSSQTTSPTPLRAALPVTWPGGVAVTRVCVRRVEVVKFAPGISVEEAEGERERRWEVVKRGRFEVVRVGGGVGGSREGDGFIFRVGSGGVAVEREEGEV